MRGTILAETKVLEKITLDCDIEESKSIEGILENEATGNTQGKNWRQGLEVQLKVVLMIVIEVVGFVVGQVVWIKSIPD